MQRELLKAYESKQLNGVSIRSVKRLIDQRRFIGKDCDLNRGKRKTRTSAESLINTYKRECQRQKLLVKKARLCEAKLVIIVTAFSRLLVDDNFVTLLRAERLVTLPTPVAERLSG